MTVKTTAISWTDATWNMIHAINRATGKRGWHCEHVTEACRFCYAEKLNLRAGDSGGTGLAYKPGHRKDIDIFLNEDALLRPLHWRAPRKIFPCSMTDLGADFVPDQWLDKIFAVMALCPQHQFQVLSKRPARLRAYLSDPAAQARICAFMWEISAHRTDHMHGGWPLRNVWIGTSICDQGDADKFVPELLHTPAAIRFLSCEPLLGQIDLSRWVADPARYLEYCDAVGGPHPEIAMLNWVIAGGESGPEARPMHPDWARSLRDQCAEAGVAFHFKQQGEFLHETQTCGSRILFKRIGAMKSWPDGSASARVGVRTAGRLLDGVEHNAFPEAA